MRVLFILSALIFGFSVSADAQIFSPVKWTFNYEDAGAPNEYNLIFTAKIDEGWSVYSQYLESDEGPVASEFSFDAGDHYSTIGKNEESGNIKTKYDKVFEMNLTKFQKTGIFTQKIKVTDASKPITGYLTFMTCDDERCLPPTDVDFSFKISPKTGSTAPAEEKKTSPKVIEKTETADAKKSTPTAVPTQSKKVAQQQNNSNSTAQTSTVATQEEAAPTTPAPKSDGIFKPVTWSWESKDVGNGEYDLVFTAKIDEGWSVYSQYLESDDGPVATGFYFEEGDHYTKIGKNEESGNVKTKYDKVFEMNLTKFTETGIFTQRIKASDASTPIKGYLEFMTCDDERCLPPSEVDFSFSLNGQSPVPAIAGTNGGPNMSTGPNGETAINQAIPTLVAGNASPLGDCGGVNLMESRSLLLTFIMGFLGGLVALFTPCVFPMIPLTVSFFTPPASKDKKVNQRAGAIKNALIYGASIIGIYVAIGLLITGLFGATALQDLSTNWIANVAFFLIFVVFAFSFFGYFEITLPASWSTKTDQMADKGGLLGIFFMAFTLALVSFSCTGPIIGSALVESADSTSGPLVVMLGFSSALALPFTLFAIFPGWLSSLPQAGGWMTSLKVVLGFLELALALKFLSVADLTMHWGILPYEVFLGLWVLIFAAMTAYLFGFIRFPHDPKKANLSTTRKAFGVLAAACTIYIALGFTINGKTGVYNTPSVLSGLTPPANYNILLKKSAVDPVIKAEFPSFTKCAHGLDCFKDYYQGLEYAKQQNLPVLIDFTGHGCVNCRKVEDNIWVRDKTWSSIQDDFVLISLYTDDRKKLDAPLYSVASQQKLRTVGSKWQDFQVANFKQNSQPLYVMISADEEVLGTPSGYDTLSDPDEYQEFLECGLKTYKAKTARGKQTSMK
ncbi:MAG: thiol:disulfide interchange protein [Saprospiraceae bacterium]|jgi:thiol:disulfide interchange protein